MVDLHHLYITDNNLDHIPLPLPESLQSLHLQVSYNYQYYLDIVVFTRNYNGSKSQVSHDP